MSTCTLEARPPVAAPFVCTHCGADHLPHDAHGLCHSCHVYQWRTGRPRPLDAPATTCRTCDGPRWRNGRYEPVGLECSACYAYRYRTGRPRPAHLWRRRRCAGCHRGLSLAAPEFQTLCRSCSDRSRQSVA